MDQLLVQVDEGGSRPCGVEGDSLVEVWRKWEGAGCSGARPFAEGRAPVGESAPLWGRARPCCLLDKQGAQAPIDYLICRGLKHLREVWCFPPLL